MRLLAQGFVIAFALTAVACGRGDVEDAEVDRSAPSAETLAPDEPADDEATGRTAAVSGQVVYAGNCATCHGERGRGDGPAAVGLEPPPADLTDGVWVTGDGSLAAIKNVIENGSPGTAMIGWKGTLSDAEIDALARHVQSLTR